MMKACTFLKRLLELHQKDGKVKNSEKITQLLAKIIIIYVVDKNDHETALMYESLLEQHLEKQNSKTDDDFVIDYRGCEQEIYGPIDTKPIKGRWSAPQ